ncbi:hypothetical protein SM124_03045 [Bacillus sp. 31A1R]|uniref:DksA C4-type domain-containing protein n=1 Tax=Robertmurraya mangrovi TaxID=3098077 RepID=A0ABU5IU96_9BACI|nr:hypothetical protein [Bacillus sp. 31A1R]MDZ5470721.1 hypothetical protein [Bacillus sp. 31A1R]
MEAFEERLYSELRKTQEELLERLENGNGSKVKQWIKEELDDINSAIGKLQKGDFGKCEISGELIPLDLLKQIPTLKTLEDCQGLDRFYCKSIY